MEEGWHPWSVDDVLNGSLGREGEVFRKKALRGGVTTLLGWLAFSICQAACKRMLEVI